MSALDNAKYIVEKELDITYSHFIRTLGELVESHEASNKEVETLKVLLAWEASYITEGQAAKLLGVDRLEARNIRHNKLLTYAGVE